MDQINPVAFQEAPTFDYREMDAATADEAQAIVSRYRVRARAYIMDTGRDLLAMKERLEHGLFTKWVEGALSMSPRSAQNYMQAASVLGDKSETVSHLPPTTLYKLAALSTPAPIREEIVRRLEAGEPLTPKAIEGQLWTARAEARQAEADAKLTPDERKRRSQTKKASESRRKREHEKWQQETEERRRQKDADTDELARLLASRLDDHTFKAVVDLLRTCDAWRLPDALIAAYGPPVGEGDG